jgi:hypothetical protein
MTIMLCAETFNPNYRLKGVILYKDNHVAAYQIPRGVSIDRATPALLFQSKLKTKYEIEYGKPYGTYLLMFNDKRIPNLPIFYQKVDSYHQTAFQSAFRKNLYNKTQILLKDKNRTDSKGFLKDIVIKLPPEATPKLVRKIMGGTEAARLNLSGSQRLTMGYSHNESSRPGTELSDNKNSDLNIRQDLNLSLKGTIGQKIHVDVTHSTASLDNVFSSPSVVKIWYEGLEDEVVKKIEGGDVAFQLSGSKFFGNAASSQGLFGVKTELQAGNLKVTTIIGKEESQKDVKTFKPGRERASSEKRSSEYEKDKFFYTVRPDSLFVLYDETVDGQLPLGWHQNAIKHTNGILQLNALHEQARPLRDSTIYVFLDNGVVDQDDIYAIDGKNIVASDTTQYKFHRTFDFFYSDDTGILKINQNITDTYRIGIAYHDRNLNFVGDVNPSVGAPIKVKIIRKTEQDSTFNEWLYSARNQYYLGATNIRRDGFSLNIFDTHVNPDGMPNYDISSEIANNYNVRTYIDYLRIDTSDPLNVIDGDDEFINLMSGMLFFPFLEPFKQFETVNIYGGGFNWNDVKTKIKIDGQVSADQIQLPAMNILPGSVSIKVDGSELQENIDYMVDYDFGNIMLLSDKAKSNTSDLEVRYEYKPLFSLENRTLIGTRADLRINENLKFGSTFIYQSEKVLEDRPKIGSENRSMMMADFDVDLKFDPPLLTRMIDFLPLIKTDADSEIRLTAEVGMSVPRIWGNKDLGNKKQAYVEDMESILETMSLGISRVLWVPASKPINTLSDSDIESLVQAKMFWFDDNEKYRSKDIYDNLQEKEGQEKAIVMACKINEMGEPDTENWQGIMRYLGGKTEISKKSYIQVLAKVNHYDSEAPVFMHINLGQNINEDFYIKNNGQGVLNTEDKNSNSRLDLGEDTGLDGIEGADDKNIEGDDGDDDYRFVKVNGEYPFVNGMEKNGKLDTEDLNRNGVLDVANRYAQYTIRLDETSPYYISTTGLKHWNLYRIPLIEYDVANDLTNETEVDLDKIYYARLWFQVTDSVRIDIAELDIVGNKWKKTAVRNELDQVVSSGAEQFSIGVIDNQRNPHYVSPPNSTIKKNNIEMLEQSLMIVYDDLERGNKALVYQNIYQSGTTGTGLDLRSYEEMRFWIYCEYPENEPGDELNELIDVVFRIGADSTHYYEIRESAKIRNYDAATGSGASTYTMDKNHWKEIRFKFSDLTLLKLDNSPADTTRFSLKGNPTISNIKYLSVGVDAINEFSGQLYVNEIRVVNPNEDIGFAARSSFRTQFADFSTLNINLDWFSPNFQTSAERRTYTIKGKETRLTINNSYQLHKFFPSEWGLRIPLEFMRNYSEVIPIYAANSDILREDLSEEDKKRNISISLSKKATMSFSQSKTPRNKILAYTVKNTDMNFSVEQKEVLTATNADTSYIYAMTHNYNLTIPKEKLGLRIFKNYHIFFLPNTFQNRFQYNQTDPKKWTYRPLADTSYWEPTANTTKTKTLATSTGIRYDIFSDLYSTYDLKTDRNLMLTGEWKDIPIGQEIKRDQDIFIKHSPRYYDRIFTLTSDINLKYNEERRKQATSDTLRLTGGNFRQEKFDIQFKNSDILRSWGEKIAARSLQNTKPDPAKQEENEKSKQAEIDEKNRYEEKTDYGQDYSENDKEKEREYQSDTDGKDKYQYNDKTDDREKERDKQIDKDIPQKSGNFLANIFLYVSRLQNIRITYTNKYDSRYDYRNIRPDFLYQIGLSGDVGLGELNRRSYSDSYNFISGFILTKNLNSTFGYSYEINKNYTAGNNSQTINKNFPNLSLRLNKFESVFSKLTKWEDVLESSYLESRFNYILNASGIINWVEPHTEKHTYSLEPLLSWQANWRKSFTTSLSYHHVTANETNNIQNVERTDLKQTVRGNASFSFTAPTGLKIPFIGSRIRFDNKLTTGLEISYLRDLSTSYNVVSGLKDKPVNKYTLRFTPTMSYDFNRNIKGGLSGKYDITNNKRDNEVMKIFEINAWVEIKF